MRSLISITELSRGQIEDILIQADAFKKQAPSALLEKKILASCFFEPSTRTRLSFETAMLRLGGQVIGFAEADNTSAKKGETLSDTIRMVSTYADVIVLRHPKEGAARLAAEMTDKPVINAGDGGNQHPSQTLLDLFSIKETQKKLDGLHLAIAGDLKHARTAHSLVLACALFDIRLYLISSETLTLPDQILSELRKRGIKFSFHPTIEEVIPKIDVLYMTRLQKERFDGPTISLKNPLALKAAHLHNAKENLKILHPLPRVDEIESAVDTTPHAYYFEQAANALPVRQALLASLLQKEIPCKQ